MNDLAGIPVLEARELERIKDLPLPRRVRRYSDSPPHQTTPLSTSTGPLVCPHCHNNIKSPRQQRPQTHPQRIPGSHSDLEEFKIAINTALKSQDRKETYNEVKALLLNWEANDLGLKTPEKGSLILDETTNLMRVFQKLYNFDTSHYLIPSENPQTKVQLKLSKVIDELSDKQSEGGSKALLIVYYNGHGTVRDGKLIWSARKEWHLDNSKYPALLWYDLQGMLERAIFDVLLILDCCHAAGAITKGSGSTMEILAGCSREGTAAAPGKGRVIGSPFTHTLTLHLEEGARKPHGLLVTELQTFLSLDAVLEDQSPIHVVLTGHFQPIKLKPLFSETKPGERETRTSEPELRVILAISFRGEILPDMEDFVQWLNSRRPKEVNRVQVESLSIEASFKACSTLMLLSMPLSTWAYLQESPSCLLVGFVKSRNNLIKQYNTVHKTIDAAYFEIPEFPDFEHSALIVPKGKKRRSESTGVTKPMDLELLFLAAQVGKETIVELLLNTGNVDVNLKDSFGQTPLLSAAKNGHDGIVKLLLKTGNIDVESKSQYGETPLLCAARYGHETVVKQLLETGKVDVESKNQYRETPLLWAARNGHEAVVKLLLKTGKANVESGCGYGETLLLCAARNGHEAVVKLLLETGKVNVESGYEYGETPLWWAARNGHEAIVKLLLETGNVNVESGYDHGETPLWWAARNGHEAVVKLLLKIGKVNVESVCEYGETPLLWAARNGHKAVVKLLLETGKVNIESGYEYGETPLLWAARNGHEAVVKLLLKTGKVDVKSKNQYGQTPLLWAARNGHEAVVELLKSCIKSS